MKSKKVGKPSVGPIKLRNGKLTGNPNEMCNEIAHAFGSVFSNFVPTIPAPYQEFQGNFSMNEISIVDVHRALGNLNPNSALGPDGVHPRLLKECSSELTLPLYLIFNLSVTEKCLPAKWKPSSVTPLFKKGCRSDPLNYRPISLTSIPCKVLERLIAVRLLNYLEENSILSSRQFGFRPGRSTLDQLILTYEQISSWLNEGSNCDIILFDFSKAFDVVSHIILLENSII